MSAPILGQIVGGPQDGAAVVDASACALALFVTTEGETNVQSPYALEDVVVMLRQIADNLEARVKP